MKKRSIGWQKYERLVASLLVEEQSTDLCVTANARVTGKISGRSRQIDVLIDSRHDTDNSRRIIVDAKMRKRKIDVIQVEAFLGLMADTGATHGYLVCPVGHTDAALKRAQDSVRICLIPLDQLDNFNPDSWPNCQKIGCNGGRVFWDGFPALWMNIRPVSDPAPSNEKQVSFIHKVGKCDRCGRFHLHCMTCGVFLSFDDESGEHQCNCGTPWFWLASIESDHEGSRSAELHVVLIPATQWITVDRRPL